MGTNNTSIVDGLLKWWHARFGIVAGSRNANLYKLAAAFNKYGIPQVEALKVCLRYVDITGADPLTAREITATVASAYRRTEHAVKEWSMGVCPKDAVPTPLRRTLSDAQARAVEDRLVEVLAKEWRVASAPLPNNDCTTHPGQARNSGRSSNAGTHQAISNADHILRPTASDTTPPQARTKATQRAEPPKAQGRDHTTAPAVPRVGRSVLIGMGAKYATHIRRRDDNMQLVFETCPPAKALVFSERKALQVLDEWRNTDHSGPDRCRLVHAPTR